MGNFIIDESKGFDVMRGKTVVEHFDNYEDAWAYARQNHLTLRCWELRN